MSGRLRTRKDAARALEFMKGLRRRVEKGDTGGRWGIGLASSYLTAADSAGTEAAKFFDVSPDQWALAMKEAEKLATYCDAGSIVDDVLQSSLTEEERDLVRKGWDIPNFTHRSPADDGVTGACMIFDCTLTTMDEDRDGDILDPMGADVDPMGPLLFNHVPLQPIGRPVKILEQTDERLREREAILDFPLGRDCAKLIEFGAMRRMSHGFLPLEYEPRREKGPTRPQQDDDQHFRVRRYEMLERSVVSIASNRGAVIEAWNALGEKCFSTTGARMWAKGLYDGRQKVYPAAKWEEGDHPRAENGRFGSGGGGKPDKPKTEPKEEPKEGKAKVTGDPKDRTKPYKVDGGGHKIPPEQVREFIDALKEGDKVKAKPKDGEPVEGKVKKVEHGEHGKAHVESEGGIAHVLEAVSEFVEMIRMAGEMLGLHGESADTLRWNKSLSPIFDQPPAKDGRLFDPLSVDVEAGEMFYDWASKFLDVPVSELYENGTTFRGCMMGSQLHALRNVLLPYKCRALRNINGRAEVPPVYETIELNSRLREDFLVSGSGFYADGEQASFVLRLHPSYDGIRCTVITRRTEAELNRKLVDDTLARAKENNFLKGEAFAVSGEFIEKTDETWDDIFLEPENKAVLQRAVAVLNKQGKTAAARGIMCCGEPGTGKTKAGRTIRNTVNATFIWVSARDFHYGGSFGTMQQAFDLAKELAPSVIFFEDVDNWLYDTTIDYLKSEMDGIGRSAGVLTILTTNFPERIPEALIDRPGRFHDVLKIGLPDGTCRKAMLEKWLPEIAGTRTLDELVQRTDGMSGAHLYELTYLARLYAEEDETDHAAAVTKAMGKIEEQRDLITGIQLGGSHYRLRKEVASFRVKAMRAVTKNAMGQAMTEERAFSPHVALITNDGEYKATLVVAPGITVEQNDKNEPMSYRFDSRRYSAWEAVKWLREKNISVLDFWEGKVFDEEADAIVNLPLKTVDEICPDCATKMRRMNLKTIKVRTKEMPPQLLEGLCKKVREQDHPFTYCMGKDFGDFEDEIGDSKESFCAWLTKKCTGHWPTEKPEEGKSVDAETREALEPLEEKKPKCGHMNADGTFKGGFDGCVSHLTSSCGGDHSEESAKKICGKIAQDVGKSGRHVAEIRAIGEFTPGSFVRTMDHYGPGIHTRFGSLKGTWSLTLQGIGFDSDKFTAVQARSWLSTHGHKTFTFEPATTIGGIDMELGTKAGRALSAANETKLKSALNHLWVCSTMKDIPDEPPLSRPHRTLLTKAHGCIKDLLAVSRVTAGSPSSQKPESPTGQGMGDKSGRVLSAEKLGKLSEADDHLEKCQGLECSHEGKKCSFKDLYPIHHVLCSTAHTQIKDVLSACRKKGEDDSEGGSEDDSSMSTEKATDANATQRSGCPNCAPGCACATTLRGGSMGNNPCPAHCTSCAPDCACAKTEQVIPEGTAKPEPARSITPEIKRELLAYLAAGNDLDYVKQVASMLPSPRTTEHGDDEAEKFLTELGLA